MELLQVLVQRIDQLHRDQSTRFDRLEDRLHAHIAATEQRLDHVDGRLNRWTGAIGVAAALVGSGFTMLVTAARAKLGN
jgi:hypothetical protein